MEYTGVGIILRKRRKSKKNISLEKGNRRRGGKLVLRLKPLGQFRMSFWGNQGMVEEEKKYWIDRKSVV